MSVKEKKYAALLPVAESLLAGECDAVARMANLAALIHREFGFWWTGFYRVDGDELVPVRSGGEITGVLDIDSRDLSTFDETDALWLEKMALLLVEQ